MSREFVGQVVVVTGGSRGIGRAIVERFAAKGAKVYFTFHQNAEAAAQVAARCKQAAILGPHHRHPWLPKFDDTK